MPCETHYGHSRSRKKSLFRLLDFLMALPDLAGQSADRDASLLRGLSAEC